MLRRKFLALPLLAASSVQAASACPVGKVPLAEAQQEKGATFQGPLDVDTLERENMIRIPDTGKKLPFGYLNKNWLELKSQMKSGDEIFFVTRRDGSFELTGHVLVSNGCIVYFLMGSIT